MFSKLICRIFGHVPLKRYKFKGSTLMSRRYTGNDKYDCERCHKSLLVKRIEIHLG